MARLHQRHTRLRPRLHVRLQRLSGRVLCASYDYASGELICADACVVDLASCSTCGDDVINGDDVCDGSDLDDQTSSMEVTLEFVQVGSVTFWSRTDTELGFDTLRFSIDQSLGVTDWSQAQYNLVAGIHTLRSTYVKDEDIDGGSDTVWVDEVVTVGSLLP